MALEDPHPPSTGSGQRPAPSPKAGEGGQERKTNSIGALYQNTKLPARN
jgi:hypothetical protein